MEYERHETETRRAVTIHNKLHILRTINDKEVLPPMSEGGRKVMVVRTFEEKLDGSEVSPEEYEAMEVLGDVQMMDLGSEGKPFLLAVVVIKEGGGAGTP